MVTDEKKNKHCIICIFQTSKQENFWQKVCSCAQTVISWCVYQCAPWQQIRAQFPGLSRDSKGCCLYIPQPRSPEHKQVSIALGIRVNKI